MQTILFRQLIQDNYADIKAYMNWQNYDLNETVLPVVEDLKDHALILLMNSYGMFHVEQDILDPFLADVFVNFPILMQQLSISRLMEATAVPTDDENTETLTRTEVLDSETEQQSELTVGTAINETTTLDTEHATTGTVTVAGTTEQTGENETDITNSSGVQMTGSRTVNLANSMPEQSISGSTSNFPVDPEGTPILSTSTVQSATQSFTTANPIDTSETSNQVQTASNTTETDQTTTNNITVADTGTTSRVLSNSGKDNSDSLTKTDSTNTITETRTLKATNKQYAYEIKAFLESTETLVAFRNWENQFSWVCGII